MLIRFFLRKGWEVKIFLVYTISENALKSQILHLYLESAHRKLCSKRDVAFPWVQPIGIAQGYDVGGY